MECVKLVLVGLVPSQLGMQRSCSNQDVCVFNDVSSFLADREALQQAALVVLRGNLWEEWAQAHGLRALPPAYVVVTEQKLPYKLISECFANGAVGFGHTDSPSLRHDIEKCWKAFQRSTENNVVRVGTFIERENDGDEALIGWGMGASARARVALGSALRDVQPIILPGGVGDEWPFGRMSPVAWLDLYHYQRFGGPLEQHTADDLFNREAQQAARFGSKQEFQQEFEKWFFPQRADGGDMLQATQPVLLLGETGTGKMLAACELHAAIEKASGLKSLPFTHINCSTLGNMADVELFGAMAGAYTDRATTHPGAIFATCGGTLFLDEFGTLPAPSQALLLLYLEDWSLKPSGWLGGSLRVPVQVVAATNEDLPSVAGRDGFRADLFYRFRGTTIKLPPLRETKTEDLPYLVDYLLQDKRVDSARIVKGISRQALEKLAKHDFPGNVRELQRVLGCAVARVETAGQNTILAQDIEFEGSTLPRQDSVSAIITRDNSDGTEILLHWNSHWRQYFLPGGRVEKETYDGCLQRELKEKLRLESSQYVHTPIAGLEELRLIQYSSRDKKLKEYHFHPYRVTVKEQNRLNELADGDGTRWVRLAELMSGDLQRSMPISETLVRFEAVFRKLGGQKKEGGDTRGDK